MVLCAALISPGCKRNPPFVPTPELIGLAIAAGVDLVVVGRVIRLVAEAVYDDGSRETVTASWTSESPDIATTAPGGDVTGVAPGRTTIQASYLGLVATLALLVLPDLTGVWFGRAPVVNCTATAFFVTIAFCATRGPGTLLPFQMDLTQDGRRLSGTAQWESLPFSGPVSFDLIERAGGFTLMPAGEIVLEFTQENGTFRANLDDPIFQVEVPFAVMRPDTNLRQTGYIFTGAPSDSASVQTGEFQMSR